MSTWGVEICCVYFPRLSRLLCHIIPLLLHEVFLGLLLLQKIVQAQKSNELVLERAIHKIWQTFSLWRSTIKVLLFCQSQQGWSSLLNLLQRFDVIGIIHPEF